MRSIQAPEIFLPDGRTLRVAVQEDRLVFAVGFGRGVEWNPDPGEALILPASVRGQVEEALQNIGRRSG